jgi:hypothetical protein
MIKHIDISTEILQINDSINESHEYINFTKNQNLIESSIPDSSDKKIGILNRIWEAIKNLFKKIKDFFRKLFGLDDKKQKDRDTHRADAEAKNKEAEAKILESKPKDTKPQTQDVPTNHYDEIEKSNDEKRAKRIAEKKANKEKKISEKSAYIDGLKQKLDTAIEHQKTLNETKFDSFMNIGDWDGLPGSLRDIFSKYINSPLSIIIGHELSDIKNNVFRDVFRVNNMQSATEDIKDSILGIAYEFLASEKTMMACAENKKLIKKYINDDIPNAEDTILKTIADYSKQLKSGYIKDAEFTLKCEYLRHVSTMISKIASSLNTSFSLCNELKDKCDSCMMSVKKMETVIKTLQFEIREENSELEYLKLE